MKIAFTNASSEIYATLKRKSLFESPFITVPKMRSLKPIFESLVKRKVEVFIITRHPEEHDPLMAEQSEAGI